ncbi:MAG: EAL domain-containing protein [Clostridia bacterium]|nr:EAL domain-containing protein [Clostridia bacterium]
MRKPHAIPLALLLTALLLCCAAPAVGEQDGGALTVGVPVDRCPVFYLDAETNEIVGIGVDLMRAAAEKAGYAVTFRAIEGKTLKDALDDPAYDVVMPFGSAIVSASGQASAVSENLFQTPMTLVTEGGRKQMPALNILRVGMLRSMGGAAETVLELYPGIEISMYETMDECVKALRAGQVDALLHNSYVWSYVLQKPAYSDLTMQPAAMFAMDFRAGTVDTPAGRAILERLNGGIAALTDPQRQAVVLDHTSRRLYRYDFSDYLQLYGPIFVLGVLLFAAMVFIILEKRRAYRQKQEEKLRWLMDHDELTGALSLDGFRNHVAELLAAHPDIPYLLSYVNIKNFKYINDSLGRAGGDELLRFWVERTQATLSEEEAIGRVEADHFAVLRRSGGDEKIRLDDHKVIDSVRSYFIDRGKENRVQICGGIYALTPEDYRQPDVNRMLDYARVAEKRVRETEKDGYAFYNPDQWEKGKRTAEVVNQLPAAIRSGEIQVWYQPQANCEKGAFDGAEALCRWNHPGLGWLHPTDFIPILEDAGLIFDLDCFIWDRVCQDLRRWNAQGKRRSVSVNLSRCDIRSDRDIPGHFSRLIQTYGLTPDQLHIEITETAFAENPELLISTTVKLREAGFEVEMDDFGSGYSSLHMLKEVPVDRIKLDLHFLTGTGDAQKGSVIISYIIQMVRSLGMHLIAEGVETAEQAQFLQSRGCTEMQGYYFCKPLPVEQFEQLSEKITAPTRTP